MTKLNGTLVVPFWASLILGESIPTTPQKKKKKKKKKNLESWLRKKKTHNEKQWH